MNKAKAEDIVARLLSNAAGLRYGTVSVTVKLHEGRIVGVTHSTTENTQEQEPQKNKNKKDECKD